MMMHDPVLQRMVRASFWLGLGIGMVSGVVVGTVMFALVALYQLGGL